MIPRERRRLAHLLARHVFDVLGGPDRIAAKFKGPGCGLRDAKGEVEGGGLALAPLACHLEIALSRYVLAERRAKRAKGKR